MKSVYTLMILVSFQLLVSSASYAVGVDHVRPLGPIETHISPVDPLKIKSSLNTGETEGGVAGCTPFDPRGC